MDIPKQILKIQAQIHQNVFSKKRICLIDGCSNYSINSHLLQQNGILNTISENGHFYEIKPKDIFRRKANSSPLEFKLIGIRRAISLPLFCNKHDSSIFKPLESAPIDLHSYQNQMLLSYRAICAEFRKKEQTIEYHTRLLSANSLKGYVDEKRLNIFMSGNKLGYTDMKKYKTIMEYGLSSESQNFTFSVYTYPLIKVYGSATFSLINSPDMSPIEVIPQNTVFVHIVPSHKNLHVIIGHNTHLSSDQVVQYCNSWKHLNMKELELKLSDLLATRIESWGMAPSLFRKIPRETLNNFLNHFLETTLQSLPPPSNINIFDNCNYGTS